MILIEEMNKIEIENLCFKHGFSWDKIGEYIRIQSKRDTWYIKDINHDGRLIELEHQNKYRDARFHSQGKHENLKNIFKSIESHDHREELGHRNNKLTRITNTFKLLGLYN
ncbi:hypothetical protein G9F71_008510 [Clostridium sp. FP2]|uniref:hypothetical protein n=1 Tax=Clostridium sp. FP2 TaxID=2724481 RepID=UPI001CCC2BAD|nr:hypothetical protein [Clostridium sp. FP2]MBZ9622894.1 hypothetical protein [Clostridium sp. FP2]